MVSAEALHESMNNTERPPAFRLLRLVMRAHQGMAVRGDDQMIK
jgi:hypothetical protein